MLILTGLVAGAVPFASSQAPVPSPAPAQGPAQSTYTIYTSGDRRALPFRQGTTDTVALDQIASLFQFSVREDLLVEGVVGGLTISTTGERILLIPGQSWAQVAGDVRSLSGPVEGERGAWRVPIDFLSRALGPATSTAIQVRRGSRVIVVGAIQVPTITGRMERLPNAGRLVLDIQPATPHTVSRQGNQLIIRFEAEALDVGLISGSAPEFVAAARATGSSLIVDLGPQSSAFQVDDDPNDARLAVELGAPPPEPAPVAPVTPTLPAAGDPPVVDIVPSGVIRTVVIDPGHGGRDEGARSPGDLVEKQVTLQVARQVKAALESRLGLRVLLTRDGDDEVPLDRRSALANNNKADLFISLHADASHSSAIGGAQVMSLSVEDYPGRARAMAGNGGRIAILGGGTRAVDAVPWDLAQLPHASRSVTLGRVLVRRLLEQGVTMFSTEADQQPLRVLVGTNMPAVLVEMGFLTNPDDERALRGDRRAAVVEAIVAAITELRNGIPAADDAEGGR